MKSLFKTTENTPKTSTWVIIISLLSAASDFIFSISEAIGMGENTVSIVGASISFVILLINVFIDNGVIQSVDKYAELLMNKILKK